MSRWWLIILLPTGALAKTESWPRIYNDGVSAYHSNDFARAATLFENATASADRTLQQHALYNLGNAAYRLGEAQPPQAQPLWQRALKSYESALALDPHDPDVKYNHEFVKKKLEELKEQQQEQPQQNQKNQQDKKQDQKKDEQKQQQEQNQQQNKSEDKQSEQQNQQQPQQSPEEQKQDQKSKDEQQQQQAQEQNSSQPEQQSQDKGGQPENYDKMQAAVLLDELRENERNWNFFPEVQMKDLKDSGEPAKDW